MGASEIPAFGMFLGAIIIGALVGAAIVVESLRRGRLEVRTVELPRQVYAVDGLNIDLELNTTDGQVVAVASHHINMEVLRASAVQTWLDQHGLIAQPKGRDFKVPARGAETQNMGL